MIKKYNLALTPLSMGSSVIALSQQLSSVADHYRLGKQSLPHITLFQFKREPEALEAIWDEACNQIQTPITLTLQELKCVTFDNRIFWASLMPDHREELHRLHGVVADILQLPIKPTFDPHMSLINSKDAGYVDVVAVLQKSYVPLTDQFVLTLGASDPIGQMTEVICIKK
jgi:2'-5' RNA ligase